MRPLPDGGTDAYSRSRRAPGQPTTEVHVGSVVIGGPRVIVAAGPCSVEPNDSLQRTAAAVRAAGASILRAGAFKPRTSPYDFQGLGRDGLAPLAAAGKATGMPVVTEVLDPRDVAAVAESADMLQIGSRSVQNVPLLREAGRSGKPVLLKRGMMTTVHEWLCAAEYVQTAGDSLVVFCERGIRTFDDALRNTLDLGSVALLKQLTHLPVLVDPSHACGDASLVGALSAAAVAVGADGLLVETHVEPTRSFSDADQALSPEQFAELMVRCRAVALAIGRTL
jgi:3-deoxy-7-phosphoheptulonate synthase